jgi:hypothetical protein
MLKRIVGVIGWVGTALVFGAVAIRFLRPEWMQYGQYMTWAGLVCILLYMIGQWRDVVSFYGTRQARYGTVSIVGILVAIGIFCGDQLPGRAPDEALGSHREPGLQPFRAEPEDRARSRCAGPVHGV